MPQNPRSVDQILKKVLPVTSIAVWQLAVAQLSEKPGAATGSGMCLCPPELTAGGDPITQDSQRFSAALSKVTSIHILVSPGAGSRKAGHSWADVLYKRNRKTIHLFLICLVLFLLKKSPQRFFSTEIVLISSWCPRATTEGHVIQGEFYP